MHRIEIVQCLAEGFGTDSVPEVQIEKGIGTVASQVVRTGIAESLGMGSGIVEDPALRIGIVESLGVGIGIAVRPVVDIGIDLNFVGGVGRKERMEQNHQTVPALGMKIVKTAP